MGTNSTTALAQDAVAQLNERGYAIVERRADPAIMDRLLQEVQPYADKAELLKLKFFGGGLRKVESVVTKSHAFVTLMADPLLHEINEAILGPESLLNGASVFILEKGGRDQTLHNDGTIYEPMLPRAPGGPHYLLIFMWAVTDFTKENGATHAIPGSHLWPAGRQPTPDDPIDYLEMPRGSFAIWLGTTFHGAGSNNTDIPRVGVQMGFNCGWLRPHEANLLLVPPLVARDLPLNVQEVLGYRAHRGMLGCIEQQSPIEKLGTVTTMTSSSRAVAQGPDPFAIEAGTRQYFERTGQDVPSAVASELNQLALTNATRAASAYEDQREVLETVAHAQARDLMNHLVAGNFDDLVAALHRGADEHVTAATPTA
jgi:ectoine hydroxylase-related dioxygenase (phytanoyl-CoA dioxygenase family)